MQHVIIRLPKIIEYEPGRTKQLHPFNTFLTDKNRFQANGFDLDESDFDTYGLRTVDGNHVSIFPASFHDEYDDIERGPQIMTRKDIGYIITRCGITEDATVLDAGSGSGALAIYLARVADHVDTYDVDERSLNTTRKNVEALGVDDIAIHDGDITQPETIDDKEYDVFTVDIPDAYEAIPTAMNAVRLGGFVVAYTPQITQAQRFVTESPKGLHHEETVDIDITEWEVGDDVLRPKTKGVRHTGFLTVMRRID